MTQPSHVRILPPLDVADDRPHQLELESGDCVTVDVGLDGSVRVVVDDLAARGVLPTALLTAAEALELADLVSTAALRARSRQG